MKTRWMMMGMMALVVGIVGAGLWAHRATGYTGCAGDQTNSAVVAEWLFSEGSGTNAFNTGTDGEAGNLSLLDGASLYQCHGGDDGGGRGQRVAATGAVPGIGNNGYDCFLIRRGQKDTSG